MKGHMKENCQLRKKEAKYREEKIMEEEESTDEERETEVMVVCTRIVECEETKKDEVSKYNTVTEKTKQLSKKV